MTAINKFNKSLLYTIRSPHTDKYYIGSTTQILCKRFGDHKRHYKQYLQTTRAFVSSSYKILELGDAYIELLEEVNCENKAQLEKREGEIIREHKANCVNHCIPGRSIKEWVHDNVEQQKQYHAQYYKDNLNKLKHEQINYRLCNAEKIKEQRRQYRNDNKDRLNEARRAKKAQQKLVKDLKTITI